jgi:hypothetical protein
MKRTPLFLAFLLSLSLITAPSFAAVKAGNKCTKAGATSITAGKKFTCVKSGNKLVWNKGVAVKAAVKPELNPIFKPVEPTPRPTTTTPTATAAPTPTPTATPTPEIALPNEYSPCSVLGAKVINSTGAMRCSWLGHANTTAEANQRFAWLKHVEFKISTSQSNNYATVPVENASCTNSGDTYDVTGGKLECRWVHGKKLQWIKINSVKNSFINAKSPVPIDVCKLQMSASKVERSDRVAGAGQVGFPFANSEKNGMFINGTNEVLIVPVDFPDFQGGTELKAQLEYDKKMLIDWYDYFSGGKSKFSVTTIDRWIRLPKPRSEYPTDEKSKDALAADSNKRQSLQAQNFIDEVTKFIDLRKFSTVYLFFPDGNYEQGDLIVRNQPFKIKEGQKNLNFFSWGRNLEGTQTLKWAYYIHETLHDFNIVGHAPGNGWPFGTMTNQVSLSQAMNPWEQFLLGWLPSEQIYCDDATTLKPVTLSLSPLEREDKQTKMAVIKLSPTKAIVVESHGIDKWSDFNAGGRAFPPGFYSVMAYVVDLDKANFLPIKTDADSQLNDEWAWAVWQKPVGGRSNEFNLQYFDWNKVKDYVAVLGDSFEIEGVRIKFMGTGDYETIEISKA